MEITRKKFYKAASAVLLLIMFVFMCYDAEKQSFWLDELSWTVIYLAKSNFFDMLRELSAKGYNLPLHYIIMFPIYKLVPYGELWLLLPNFFAILLGICSLKKIGDIIGGEDLGFCSVCIAVTSYALIYRAGYELRPYAFLFLFSTWALYRFICLLENDSRENQMFYALSIVLLSYTHWFGGLIVAFYFLLDVVRILRKKVRPTIILSYIYLGICFAPWLFMMIAHNQIDPLDYWGASPSVSTVINTIKYLLSDNSLCIYLLAVGVFCFLLYALSKRTEETAYQSVCVGSIIWVIGTIFIYSKFVNPNGSLYVQRYFMVLLPHVFTLVAIPLAELLHFEIKINDRKLSAEINGFPLNRTVALLLAAAIVGSIGFSNYSRVHEDAKSIYEPYREMSDKIIEDNAAYQNDSALVVSQGKGFLHYYFIKRGYPVPPNVYIGSQRLSRAVANGDDFDFESCEISELLQYNTLYMFNVHTKFKENIWDFINDNYELKSEDKTIAFYVYEKR